MKDTIISKKLHDYFRSFLNQVSRPEKKNFIELARGLVLSGTVIISEIIRVIEDKACTRKGVERISNMLEKYNTEDMNKYIIITKHINKIHEKTIIAVDNSDSIREYAKCMEGIGKVHDGSKGEIKLGFEIFGSSYIDDQGKSHMLQFELYSREVDDYESEYKEWEKNMNNLLGIIHPDAGIFVMDCGYDAHKYYEYLLGEKKDFVIRVNDRRKHPRKVFFEEIDEALDIDILPYSKEKKKQVKIKNKKNGRVEDVTVKVSKVKIRLTKDGEKLNLVRIKRLKKGSKARIMYLLTTLEAKGVNQILNVYETYLKRWKIEELFRSIKQNFQLEKVRLKKLERTKALFRIIAIMHNFLTHISKWIEITKSEIFYKIKKIQEKTQKMTFFTAVLRFTRKEWGYWKYSLHSMFFRSSKYNKNLSQLTLFNDNLLFNA